MKNKEKNKSNIVETTAPSKPEAEEIVLTAEPDLNAKIAVKTYREPARPYFSSPCLLSEMEDNDEISDRYF